jgi:hypothetical protein
VDGVGGERCTLSENCPPSSLRLRLRRTLAVEDVAAKPLSHGHAQVDIQPDAGDAHAGIVLVLRQQEGVVVVMVVVAVAGVPVAVGEARHGSSNVSCAVRGRGPVKGRGCYLRVLCAASRRRGVATLCMCPGLQDAQLWVESARVAGVGRCAIQPVRLR